MGTWKAFSTLESCLFRSRLRYSEKEGGLYCACLTYAIFYFWINRALQLPVFFWSISLHKGCIQQIGHTVSICALFLFLSISLISFCKPPRGLYIFNCRSHLSLFLPFLVHEMKKKKEDHYWFFFYLTQCGSRIYTLYQKLPSDRSRLAKIKQLDHVNLCNSINLNRAAQIYTSWGPGLEEKLLRKSVL